MAPYRLQGQTLAQVTQRAFNRIAYSAAHVVADAIVRAHLTTMYRLNIEYDVLPRESEILHLKFWATAFELLKERKAIYFETEGKNAAGTKSIAELRALSAQDAAQALRVQAAITIDGYILPEDASTIFAKGKQ